MKKFKSYLDGLQFDPNLLQTLHAKYLTNIRLVMILAIGIVLFGSLSFLGLNRRLNPEVKIPIVTVTTAYPGAGPADVEQLVTIPLENELDAAAGLDTIDSTSQEGLSIISMQFLSDIDVVAARDEAQRLVDKVNDLPEDALDPEVNDIDFENTPVWQFMMTSSMGDRITLDRFAQLVEDELEAISSVDRVEISGVEQQVIQVTMLPEALETYQIQPAQLAGAIRAATKSLPAGNANTATSTFSISIDQEVGTIQELRELPLQINGNVVRLGEVASISQKSELQQRRTYSALPGQDPKPAVVVSVYKSSDADISETQQLASEKLDEVIVPFTEDIQIRDVDNVAEDITEQFTDLYKNFGSTILLVSLILLIFLGIKQAAVASLTIPLTFLVSFTVMNLTGQTLNFLTLFSLLLALGLLLDDAIVIISSITEYYRSNKFSATEAGLLVWRDFILPIWTTTLTTVWAFLPLLLSTGILGEFIKPIPIVVSSTLIASTAVAVLITLPLMMILLDLKIARRVKIAFFSLVFVAILAALVALNWGQPLLIFVIALAVLTLTAIVRWWRYIFRSLKEYGARVGSKIAWNRVSQSLSQGLIDLSSFQRHYQDIIAYLMESKKRSIKVVTAVVIFALFSYALLPLGYVQNEFFPKSDWDVLYVGLELPVGTNLAQTEVEALQLFEEVSSLPEVQTSVLEVGQPPVSADSFISTPGENVARISLTLVPEDERDLKSYQLESELRNQFANFDKGNLSFYSPSGGPPAGSDITVKILGDDLQFLTEEAGLVEEYLADQAGVVNIDRSIKPGTSKIVFNPDQAKLTELGLTSSDLNFWLRTALSGFELGSVTLPGETKEEDIKFYLHDRLMTPESITATPVLTSGGPQQLADLGNMTLATSPTKITRENGQRSIIVTAGVAEGYSANQINEDLFAYLDTVDLPQGYSFATGGANEENQESVQTILQAMVLSIVLILATMVIQLGSFRKALIVILVIPLAISGVFLMFALTATPLSFPALIGVLALFGIVINNSIVLVDKINQNTATGMKLQAAIVDAGGSRLPPILFSSLTTIVGLTPITLSDPLWQGLGGAIIAGLIVSGAMMLIFIPLVYNLVYGRFINTVN